MLDTTQGPGSSRRFHFRQIAGFIVCLTFAASLVAQTTNPYTSSVVTQSTATFTNTSSNCALQGMVNGASMNLFSSSGAGNYTQDAVCGGVIVPAGASVSQSSGVSGMVENHADGPAVYTGTAPMGGYFQIHQYGQSSAAWGINTVGVLFAGANNGVLQNETDFDLKAGVTGATIYGWSIQSPYLDSPPAYAAAIYVGKPGCTTPDFVSYPNTGCPQLSAAYAARDGASPVVVSAGTQGTGNNYGSQVIQLSSVDSNGTRRTVNIQADAKGNLNFNPQSPGSINLNAATTVTRGLSRFLGGLSTGTSGAANHVVCWKDSVHIGYCATQPDASGSCNCQ